MLDGGEWRAREVEGKELEIKQSQRRCYLNKDRKFVHNPDIS